MKVFQSLKKILPWLIPAQMGLNHFTHLTSKILTDMMGSGQAEGGLWIIVALTTLVSIFFPLLLQYWAILILAEYKFGRPVYREPKYFIIENLRAFGRIILWSLALILPGIIQFFWLLMTPIVVLVSPSYQDGQQDALKVSREVVQANWGKCLAWVAAFTVVLPLLSSAVFDGKHSLYENPGWAFGAGLVDSLILVWGIERLLNIYINDRGEGT